ETRQCLPLAAPTTSLPTRHHQAVLLAQRSI
ncbi:MAG: hypothetical protein AVDCRST_MAG18-649, partial [uncultured Thermomicrobiales bacterium]